MRQKVQIDENGSWLLALYTVLHGLGRSQLWDNRGNCLGVISPKTSPNYVSNKSKRYKLGLFSVVYKEHILEECPTLMNDKKEK